MKCPTRSALCFAGGLVALLALAGPAEAMKLARKELSVPGDVLWLTTGDLDNDGALDIVLSYRRGAGPHATRYVAVFFQGQSGFPAHPDVAIQAPRSSAVFDVGDAFGDGRSELLYMAPDGIYAQSFEGRKAEAPVKLLSTPSLVVEPEEDDLVAWDFLRSSGPGQPPVIVVPTRGPLKLFQRDAGADGSWKLWSKPVIEQYSFYDAETPTFRRDRRGGASGRPYSFRSTTIVPLIEFVDQTGDGKPDLVTAFEDRIAVHPRLDDGTISPKPARTVWFNVRTPQELETRDASVHTRVLDLDGDGIADAVVTKIAGGVTSLGTETRFYRGVRGGGFEEKPLQVLKDDGFAALLEFVDVDGDGRLELIQPHANVSIVSISQMMLKRELSLDVRIRRPSRDKAAFFERTDVQKLETTLGLDLSVGATLHGTFPVLGWDFDGDGLRDVVLSDGGDKMALHRGVRRSDALFDEDAALTVSAPQTSNTLVLPPGSKKGSKPGLLLYYVDRSDLAGKVFVFQNEDG